MVGEVLADRYELEELVGTGGMSSVFRAHDRLLDRNVALKILHEQYSDDEDYVERFRREARAVAALSHPNIVTVIDRGEHDGRQFIVFEYVDGENLKQLIERRGPAPVATALELAIQIARGPLVRAPAGARPPRRQAAERAPERRRPGEGDRLRDRALARRQHGMTQTGTVLGTSDYIAPEQAQGQRVDEHTDVYSLGVVLYELLTGEVPFAGDNFVAVAMRHINEPPPAVRDKRPEVPPRVEAAVQRAMAKDPRTGSRRWPSSAPSSRRASPSCRAPDADRGPPYAPSAPRAARRGRPPGRCSSLLVALDRAARSSPCSCCAHGRAAGRRPAAAGGGGAAARDGASRPTTRTATDGEHDAEAPRATDGSPARTGRPSTTARAGARQAGRRARPRRRHGRPAPSARVHDDDAGAHRRDRGGRLAERAVP